MSCTYNKIHKCLRARANRLFVEITGKWFLTKLNYSLILSFLKRLETLLRKLAAYKKTLLLNLWSSG